MALVGSLSASGCGGDTESQGESASSALNGLVWQREAGCVRSVALAYHSQWAIGCDGDGSDFHIYRRPWSGTQATGQWEQMPGMATKIAGSPDALFPWVVNSGGGIFRFFANGQEAVETNRRWDPIPGCAVDIAVANGSRDISGDRVSVVGCDAAIYQWNGGGWSGFGNGSGRAKAVARSWDGTTWVVGTDSSMYRWNGSFWAGIGGVASAQSVLNQTGGGANNVSVVGTDLRTYMFDGSTWIPQMERVPSGLPIVSLVSAYTAADSAGTLWQARVGSLPPPPPGGGGGTPPPPPSGGPSCGGQGGPCCTTGSACSSSSLICLPNAFGGLSCTNDPEGKCNGVGEQCCNNGSTTFSCDDRFFSGLTCRDGATCQL
ncbi:MAG TPA: hypothetical protein VNO55_17910 [Polyangia bacterium]|nr:hypothetical protein [Polyangia bacterium]